MMPSFFEGKKAKILEQLAVPDPAYHDASPKGSVDVGIRNLVDQINVLDTLVITSSCAGRIAVYLEGRRKGQAPIRDDVVQEANAGAGGKRGDQWFVIGYEDPRGKLVPMVDEAYMDILVELANKRFAVNTERTERFRKAFIDRLVAGRGYVRNKDGGVWEPADVRKARMRAEGLTCKAAFHDQASTTQRRSRDD